VGLSDIVVPDLPESEETDSGRSGTTMSDKPTPGDCGDENQCES